MHYSEIKDKIKSGDLVLFQGNNFVDFFIKLYSRSKWTHVGLIIVVDGVPMVTEAKINLGVTMRELKKQNFYWVKTDVRWTPEIESRVFDMLETPYSLLNLLKVAFGLGNSKGVEICTYYVDDILQIKRDGHTTPQELAEYCEKQNWSIIHVEV